ncbi:MAG TPA: hypothetical protein VF043_13470, partial [Ktedonobacteraceae bacterium]
MGCRGQIHRHPAWGTGNRGGAVLVITRKDIEPLVSKLTKIVPNRRPRRKGRVRENGVTAAPSPKNRAGHFRSTRLKPFLPPVSPDAVSQHV